MPILTPSVRVARALNRVERTLRNWQDEPNCPRSDVNRMLEIVADLRGWVQAHVLEDIERVEYHLKDRADSTPFPPLPPPASSDSPPVSE